MASRSLPKRLWYRLVRRVLQLLATVFYHVRCTGQENIPPGGGILAVANHQSNFDPPLIGMACPRRMNFLARETLFESGFLAWLMRSLDAIPIDREGIGLGGIKESLRRLKRGEIVLVFPEGTRSHDGKLGPFRPGFTTLAIRSKAAILPLAIEGAYAAWPRGTLLPRLGRIHIHFAPPILPKEIEDRGYDERQLLDEVELRVRRCHNELVRRWKK